MDGGRTEERLISIVAPMFNEEGNVARFVLAVDTVMCAHDLAYELLLVDDGSEDATWLHICESASQCANVRGLSLSRNFGHQSALFAGLHHARGQAVVTMDGDLQHPPALIPELVAAWESGFEVVTTTREDSADTGLFKRLTSRWFYALFSRATGVPLAPGSSDFRLVDARVLSAVLEMRDPDLFLRGMVSWLGFRSTRIPYRAEPRESGRSKYTVPRMLHLSVGAVLAFSMAPLRAGVWLGFITSALAFVELVYILVQYARGNTVPGWASVMTVMSLMFGVLFVLVGTIGIYLGKIYEVLKRRQRFVVRDEIGLELRAAPARTIEGLGRRKTA